MARKKRMAARKRKTTKQLEEAKVDKVKRKKSLFRLTPRERKFVQLYLESGNQTQSYIDAGYNCKDREVAGRAANRLIHTNKVQSYMAQPLKEQDINTNKLIRELSKAAFGAPADEMLWQHKLRALEMVARITGAFRQDDNPNAFSTTNILNIINKDGSEAVQKKQQAVPVHEVGTGEEDTSEEHEDPGSTEKKPHASYHEQEQMSE